MRVSSVRASFEPSKGTTAKPARTRTKAASRRRAPFLDAAIGLAEAHPFALEQADAAEFVGRRFADQKPETARVLFHSIMWQYPPETTRQVITSALLEAGVRATAKTPIAWLRMEPLDTRASHATLSLTLWPGGETRHLAKCDYHGRWIEWLP